MADRRVAIFITVRLKSTRLPRKALLPLADKTIVEHIIARARQIREADEVLICTSTHPDDDPLEDIAASNGVSCFRGSESNIVDRFIGAARASQASYGVRITGDNCLFSSAIVDELIREVKTGKYDYVSARDLPGGAKGDVFTYESLVKLQTLMQDENASEYLSWLLADEQHFRVCWKKFPPKYMKPGYRLHCDTPADYEFLKKVYADLYEPGSIIQFDRLIDYLDEHPDVVAINKDIPQVSKKDVEGKINIQLK